jgi:uncharacterized membrane protein YdbT with pleckstrin-like domain
MSYLDETLTDDEEVLYRTKPHWIIFTPALGWLFLAILILFLGPRYAFSDMAIYGTYSLLDILATLILIIALISAFRAFITYQNSEFAITNQRILMKVGFISRASYEILLQRVESIQIFQSAIGRMLNYGTIVVSGIGGSKDLFPTIPDPLLFRRRAQEVLSNVKG